MMQDASHTYFYDAESRLVQVDGSLGTCSTATACYTYGASGLRIEKVMGTNQVHYFRDLVGNPLVEKDQNSNFLADYIYQAGQLVAEYKNNTTYFPHPDHLGSTRLVTALNQSVAQILDYLPFGELNSSDSGITTHEFTGDERDSETGLDHTQFRQYTSSLGRWMHPDPAGLAAVDPSSPQSWNRYAYVLNNPLALIDPSGLSDCIDGHIGCNCDPLADDGCTNDLLGAKPRDPLGCGWADFWGGDCATENRMFGGSLTRSGAIILPYPWGQCMETTGDYVCWNNVDPNYFLYGGRGNTSGQAPQIGPQPTLKFKPPSWQNFTHEFLPCYGAQLLDNFVGSTGKTWVTLGTVALTVKKLSTGGPLLVVWTANAAFKAGSACALASRGYYQ